MRSLHMRKIEGFIIVDNDNVFEKLRGVEQQLTIRYDNMLLYIIILSI